MGEHMSLLLYIVGRSGLFDSFETSTSAVARNLGMSQQTISRKLILMEEGGLINRTVTPRGVSLALEKAGRDVLQRTYSSLAKAFHQREKAISGFLQTGLGEGAFYVNKKPYQDQFMEKLGYRAYPGTLNLKVGAEQQVKVADKEPIKVEGFATKERTYGGLDCYRAKILDQQVAIVVPDRTLHGSEVLEIIAPVFLREKLGVKDGDTIKVVPL